jgi:pimeloyl-ACP methyl ester carboxylesterase
MPLIAQTPDEAVEAGWADRWWTSADGLRLHARDYAPASGEARLPVVMLHGLTRNARDFEDLAPKVAGWGRRVLAADVRGRGQSARDPNPLNYQPPVYVADVAALLDQSGIRRAQFVGTSMGGLITMLLSVMRPDLVAGVVLNDVGPVLSMDGLSRIAAYVGKPVKVAGWTEAAAYAQTTNGHALPHYRPADWQAMARRLFRDGAGGPELDYDLNIAEPMRAAIDQPAPDLWPMFTAMAANRPVTIVRGAESDLLDAATTAGMQAAAPHAKVAEVPGVGHAPMLDEAEALAAIKAHMDAAA